MPPPSSTSLAVPAVRMWVATDVWVQPGDALAFRATGTWVDAVVPCSADGHEAPLLYQLGQLPRIPDDERYFRLMGRVVTSGRGPEGDDIPATFPIGTKSERRFAERGCLFVFANDKRHFYWNNRGAVTLTVTRRDGQVAPPPAAG